MSCCSILYPVNLRKNVTVISYCSFILDRHVRKVFFFRSSHKQGTKKKCWVMKSQTSDPCALMLCNWATETPRWAKSLLHTPRIKNVESLMCRIRKWWIVSSVVKWIKMFSAFSIASVERREKIGLNIFLTPLTHTRLSTLLILAVCGICVIYELNKRLTTLTVSLVIERLSLAWPEDLTHELSNFYFLTLRDSLELRMIET